MGGIANVFSVSLTGDDDATRNAVVEAQFEQEKQDLAKNKTKITTRLWLCRPPVEQVPLLPACSSVENLLLESIDLVEVATQVNHCWSGRILWARTIRPPFQRSNALWTLLKDENVNFSSQTTVIVPLSLWNYLPLSSDDEYLGKDLEMELPAAVCYVALAHPLLVPNPIWGTAEATDITTMPSLMLRCDDPQCFRIFDSEDAWRDAMKRKLSATEFMGRCSNDSIVYEEEGDDSRLSVAAELKEQGNEAFGKNVYSTALRRYQKALAMATTTSSGITTTAQQRQKLEIIISCLGNMAEACLQSERYEEAEAYASKILSEYDPNHFKAKFRLARALLRLNQPTQAKDLIMDLRKNHPNNAASLQTFLGECIQAIMESRGFYNISNMLREVSLSPVLPFHADYVSLQIELGVTVVRPADRGKYRGVLAREDIAEGTLLTASRAFAFAHQNLRNIIPESDMTTGATPKTHLYEVSQVHQAVSILQRNPSLGKSFYRLEAAGEVPTLDETATTTTTTVINLPRIRSILDSNRFGVDLNSPGSPFELKSSPENDDDVANIGVGLWLRESMFNHSCTPNCTWAQIGNHMFVHASKPVSKGTELCISYVHPALSYQDRKERFHRWNGGKGFECGCEWCHWMRHHPELQTMNEEAKEAQRRFTSEPVESMDQVLSPTRKAQIQKAHKTDHVPERFQHTMYNLHMMEALQLATRSDDRQGALESVKAATQLGYAIRGGLRQETRVQDLCCLVAAYMTCNEDAQAKTALETLVQHQLVLPSLTEFQTFVMVSSMPIWNQYQTEPFMQRWAMINKMVWEARYKQLKN